MGSKEPGAAGRAPFVRSRVLGILVAAAFALIAIATLGPSRRAPAKERVAAVPQAPKTHASTAVGSAAGPRSPQGVQARLESDASHMAQKLAADLLNSLSPPDQQAYASCSALSAKCQTSLNELTNLALVTGGFIERTQRLEYGPDSAEVSNAPALSAALGKVVASSSDPLERLAALVVLNYHPAFIAPGKRTPLPESAYRELALRPLPEVRLIAEPHRIVAPHSEAMAREFSSLADTDDVRFQRIGMAALGHPATAAQLNDLVMRREYPPADFHHLARAIGSCGLACASSAQHMMRQGARQRIAMYEGLGQAPDLERGELVALALDAAPKDIDDAERATRDELLAE